MYLHAEFQVRHELDQTTTEGLYTLWKYKLALRKALVKKKQRRTIKGNISNAERVEKNKTERQTEVDYCK